MLRVAILGFLLAAMVSAADAPRFEDYPVSETFRGKPVPPVLSSAKARLFRTVLRREAASGPNFAGHFTLARWGCGAGCVAIAVIDAVTGAVVFAPFAVQDAWKDGHVVCDHGTDFETTSELFTAEGEINGTVGRHFFRWKDRKFSPVYFDPHCSPQSD